MPADRKTRPGATARARIAVPPAAPLTVRSLTRDDWPVIESLFGANGACGGCWCMTWRVPRGGKLWEEQKGDRNRAAFRKLVTSGKVFGSLAFAGTDPVGWCCVGPRADFPRMLRIKALQTSWNEQTWSVTCFFIRSAWRGRGVATRLLKNAVQIAKANGAKVIEGYPVKPYSEKPIPAAFAWTGVPRLFEAQKFVPLTLPGAARDVYVRKVK